MIILIVEDEHKIASFIRRGLESEHYTTEIAYDGQDALDKVTVNDYDLIILDVMLPKLDGFEVCKQIRNMKLDVPILMLTAKESVEDRVKGLDYGADDYLVKPFAFEELLARIRSLLRRDKPIKHDILQVGDLILDPVSHEVARGGKQVDVTSKEYRLLDYLMRHANQVCSRTMIAEHIWGYDFDQRSNVIDVYMNYLRKKIDGKRPNRLIKTVRNVGYKITDK
ncbi:MAG: response regulator transcription factor [Candidatus Komeilibacteria bacterium]|nr:response regulator transcription factor [Candidatus Komeilibacteria bacterium]